MEFSEAWTDSCSTVGIAARNGNVKELKRLISQRRPVDVADNRGWRPLHEASATTKTLQCMEELLKHENTDVNWQTHEGETALLLSCKRRRGDALQAVQMLVCRGANVNITDNEDETPLLAATRSRLTDVVYALLDTREADTNLGDCSGWRPLHEAAMHGQADLVRTLLASGARLDVQDECSMTPLFTAAQYGSLECLRVLLEVAKERGQLHLVNSGAQDWATPLMIAAQQGFIDCVQLLLSYDANPDSETMDGVSALDLAVQGKHHKTLELLLQVMDVEFFKSRYQLPSDPGAPLGTSTPVQINPLHLAVEWESHACLKLLLEAGFPVDSVFTRDDLANEEEIVGNGGLPRLETPLSLALKKNDIDAAKVLLAHGASSNSCRRYVLQPMFSAILNGTEKEIDLLLEHDIHYDNSEFLLVAVVNPPNLFHMLRRGAYPRLCLDSDLSSFLHAILQLKSQEKVLRVLQILLAFVDHNCRASDLLSTLAARGRELYAGAYDIESWDHLLSATASPSSLSSICRVSLRRHLLRLHGTSLGNRIESLRIPHSLISYLNYEDILSVK